MSKETIKQEAEKLLATSNYDVLYANPKGEFFTSENLGQLTLEKGEKLTKFEHNADVEEAPKAVKILAVDAIAKIEEAKTLDDLKVFEADTRATVKAAYDEKHATLLAAIQVNE